MKEKEKNQSHKPCEIANGASIFNEGFCSSLSIKVNGDHISPLALPFNFYSSGRVLMEKGIILPFSMQIFLIGFIWGLRVFFSSNKCTNHNFKYLCALTGTSADDKTDPCLAENGTIAHKPQDGNKQIEYGLD